MKGKIIDAEKALRKGEHIMGVPSLAPSSWELIRHAQNDREEVLARNAAAFDIDAADAVVYSNGYGIFHLNSQNQTALLLQDKLIENVVLQ